MCPKGHRSITILQQQKFEVLFQIGAYAIADGYYREAVSSFASSLERLCEFFVRAVMLQEELKQETIDAAWKLVAAQSERQLGAFIFLYTTKFGRAPTLLGDSSVKFRNDVVHKGKIPSRAEAIEYGQAVLDVMRPILRETQERFPEGVSKTVFRQLSQSRSAADEGLPVSTMSMSTIVSLSIAEPAHHARSLEEAISGLVRWG